MYKNLSYGIFFISMSLAAGETIAAELSLTPNDGAPTQNAETVVLPQPKTKEQTWFSSLFDSLKKQDSKPQLDKETYEEQIVIGSKLEAKREIRLGAEKEVGFLTSPQLNTKLELAYVKKVHMENREQYALNFDGSKLIYFNLSRLIEPSSTKAAKNIHAVVSASIKGQVLLPSVIEEQVVANTINRAGILEANHISIKNNQIILDNKFALQQITN